ncbi:MAG: dihydrofolate reductase family protein [Propionibacteriaceae bacterium]
MRVQYYTATSIDGFIADAENSLDWLFQFGSAAEEVDRGYAAFLADVGVLVMGSTTYEWILDHEHLLDDPGRWPYEQPAWVLTTRDLPGLPGRDIRFARGAIADLLPELVAAAERKNLWVVGGGDVVGQFADLGRLDDLFLGVAPVTLGAGAPLLPRRLVTPPMTLASMRRLDDFVFLHYLVPSTARPAD